MVKATRLGKWLFFGVIAVIATGFVLALTLPLFQRDKMRPGRDFAERPQAGSPYPVTIRTPDTGPWIDSGAKDARGNPVMVSCATCHDTRDPNFSRMDAAMLDEFHHGLKYAHGSLSCLSCHNPQDYNTLRLADGRALEFTRSIQLCAQCHGPQYRDYQNGSHGGMTGFWDLKQGPRERNHCTDCHDPHHPKYPLVMPVFPPIPVTGETILHPQQNKAH